MTVSIISAVSVISGLVAISVVNAISLPVSNPEEYMYTLGGTRNLGGQENSAGNVMPDVQMPWGFATWSPDNQADSGGGWFFYDQSTHLAGIRCTHQPSPWIGDYAFFNVMMHVVNPQHDGKTGQYANYDPRQSTFSPYLFNATLFPYGTASGIATIEVTSTTHGGLMRFKFPPPDAALLAGSYNATRRVYISVKTTGGNTVSLAGDGSAGSPLLFTGISTDNLPQNGKLYFAASLFGGGGATPTQPISTGQGQDSDNFWAWADFDPTDVNAESLVLRVATSLISPSQALAAHSAEVAGVDFDTAVATNKAAWNAIATKVTINDVGTGVTDEETNDLLTIFYSSLYRASKFPRSLWEVDYSNGNTPYHWSPYTGAILPGVLSSDVGFWDAFRTTFSLLSLVQPAHLAEEMEGFLNTWRENGFVPQWPHPNGGGMAGTMSDVTFSEAIMKLPHCGSTAADAAGFCVNATALYAASRQNAFSRQIDYYTYGYIPYEAGGTMVSDTLLNYHADWAVSQAAAALGYSSDAAILLARANNFTLLLDPIRGFMVPKLRNGSFISDFDEFAWGPGPGYTEAGPWQYRVEVPYNPQGLKAALSKIGLDGCGIVQQANTMLPTFHAGGYGGVIHEQAEMAANCFGQWELNNQPVWALQHMQVGFDSSVNGKCAQQAQYWLRKSATLFKNNAQMYPGDEDNGSMGAWYIFNALGIYPISPSSATFILGSPLFGSVDIDVGAATPLTIRAVNQAPNNVYITGATWKGQAINGVYVAYSDLMLGGVLEFTMSATPTAENVDVMPPIF
jgi:predicted alpha-1,2-mannosidase